MASKALVANTATILRFDPRKPAKVRKPRLTREQRFWSKVDASGGPDACWLWTASIMRANGYPQFHEPSPTTGKPTARSGHRVALELHTGNVLPSTTLVLHSQTCTSRRCCNPSHLREGTHTENTIDSVAAGTHARGRRMKATDVLTVVALRRKHNIKAWVLAERFGVSVECIRGILGGRRWSKLTGIEPRRSQLVEDDGPIALPLFLIRGEAVA